MKKMIGLYFLAIVSFTFSLFAEIEQITIRWTALRCQETCGRLLEKELRKVHGIQDLTIDLQNGQAVLIWKKNIPFQYTSLNTAMHLVGLTLRDIRLKITGNTQHTGAHFFLISQGDNTLFDLVNPIVPNPKGQVVELNRYGRDLSAALKQQFLQAQANKQLATVEGPIFMPERMTVPLSIVVDKVTFNDPKIEKPN